MFGAVVALVGLAWSPEKRNWSWAAWKWSHQSCTSMYLSCLWTMVLLVTPSAVELYVCMGVLGWGHPISMRVFRMGNIALSVMKRPVSSASAAKYMKNLMIWEMVIMDSFSPGTGSSSDKNMWAPSQLHALETLRYAASECLASIMLLAR